ncbi:MAG: hypothetical protein ACI4J4_00115, partial [Ruminiclostridium sp.]
ETAESIDDISETAEEIGESAEETAESIDEIPEAAAENSGAEAAAPKKEAEESGGKYGVYSAEELINGDCTDEELKSAAEMLAEMKSKTEIMRSFAQAAEPHPERSEPPKGQYVCPRCGRSGGAHGRY